MLLFGMLLWALLPVVSVGTETPGISDQCQLLSVMHTPVLEVCLPPEPSVPESNTTATQTSWVQGDVCHRVNEDEFCAYTKPSFNRGEGISLITTAERMTLLMASKSIFNKDETPVTEQALSSKASSLPYADAEIPGKGIGLIATRPIRAGQLIMSRTPAVMVDERALSGLSDKHLARLLGSAIETLPQQHRERFLNLSTHDSSVQSNDKRAHRIFAINRFRTGSIVGGGADFHAAFTEVSRLNHDCRPNCVYYFDPATLSHKVLTVRNVMPGEELTISYVDGFQTRSSRQELLENSWGFRCSCQHCSAERHMVDESDDRIQQILRLWKELDNYSASSTATPEMAELLVVLYELEGQNGRMQEAYYRAAIEWNGVGQAEMAIKYARLCIDRGLAFKGPGKPFIEHMKELIKDPRAHRTWKFRENV